MMIEERIALLEKKIERLADILTHVDEVQNFLLHNNTEDYFALQEIAEGKYT